MHACIKCIGLSTRVHLRASRFLALEVTLPCCGLAVIMRLIIVYHAAVFAVHIMAGLSTAIRIALMSFLNRKEILLRFLYLLRLKGIIQIDVEVEYYLSTGVLWLVFE